MQFSSTETTVPPSQQEGSATPYPASIRHALGSWSSAEGEAASPFLGLAALCPIGALDSGVGGLSVVAELRQALPAEDIIYYADSANCPYGERSDEWIRARALYIAGFLLDKGAKVIVVPCNTASAAGLEHLRATYDVPIVGLVPAVKPAVTQTHSGKIGVLATSATLRGRLLADVVERFAAPSGVEVISRAPEGLVEAVERGDLDSPDTADAVKRGIEPMISAGADAIVLGCTHYPFLKPLIREIAGEGVLIIDSGAGVTRQTARVLAARNLLRLDNHAGSLTVYTSGDPQSVGRVVHSLAGDAVPVLQG